MSKRGYDLELLKGLVDSLDVDKKRLMIRLIEGMTLGEAIVDQFDDTNSTIRDVVDSVVESGEDYFKGEIKVPSSFVSGSNSKKSRVIKDTKVSTTGTKKDYTYGGVPYTSIASLARGTGLSYDLLKSRLESGMSVVDAVETPKMKNAMRDPIPVDFNGVPYDSINQLAKDYGLSGTRLYYYAIKKGMGISDAMRHLGVIEVVSKRELVEVN